MRHDAFPSQSRAPHPKRTHHACFQSVCGEAWAGSFARGCVHPSLAARFRLAPVHSSALPCCRIACRLSHVLECLLSCASNILQQSPTCLFKTRRLTDNHGMRFASERLRFSLLQKPERETLTARRPIYSGFDQAGPLSINHLPMIAVNNHRQHVEGEGKPKKQRTWHEYAHLRLH